MPGIERLLATMDHLGLPPSQAANGWHGGWSLMIILALWLVGKIGLSLLTAVIVKFICIYALYT